MQYKFIENEQTEEIANLAVCLTNEIIERTGTKHFDVDTPLADRTLQKLCLKRFI